MDSDNLCPGGGDNVMSSEEVEHRPKAGTSGTPSEYALIRRQARRHSLPMWLLSKNREYMYVHNFIGVGLNEL